MTIFQISSGDTTVSLDSDKPCDDIEQVQKLVDITVAAEIKRMDELMELDIEPEIKADSTQH